jgi:hypothetical protein
MSFFKQNTLGIKTLFAGKYMQRLTLFLVATGGMMMVVYQLLDDLLAVEYGFSPMGISILFAIACLIAGFASMYLPHVKLKINSKISLIGTMVVMGIILMLSPIVGMIMSGSFLMIRVILEVIYDNATSVEVNRNTESSVRATTLSSLSLLRSIPYALGGSFVGGLVLSLGGARNFSVWFGLALIMFTVVLGFRMEKSNQ